LGGDNAELITLGEMRKKIIPKKKNTEWNIQSDNEVAKGKDQRNRRRRGVGLQQRPGGVPDYVSSDPAAGIPTSFNSENARREGYWRLGPCCWGGVKKRNEKDDHYMTRTSRRKIGSNNSGRIRWRRKTQSLPLREKTISTYGKESPSMSMKSLWGAHSGEKKGALNEMKTVMPLKRDSVRVERYWGLRQEARSITRTEGINMYFLYMI